jgi:hypothetical protein
MACNFLNNEIKNVVAGNQVSTLAGPAEIMQEKLKPKANPIKGWEGAWLQGCGLRQNRR